MIKKIVALALLSFIVAGCSNQVDDTLDAKLAQYKKCYTNEDYICTASMALPSLVEEAGGVEGFVQLTKSVLEILEQQGVTMDAAHMNFGEHGEIVTHNEVLVSVVPTKQPIVVQGKEGSVEGAVIAFSEDVGETWFFLEGNDEGKMAIANVSPAILQKIDIPVSQLKFADLTLTQKNGQWTKQ